MPRGLTKLNSLDCSRYLGVIALARVDHVGLTVRPCDGGGRAPAAWTGVLTCRRLAVAAGRFVGSFMTGLCGG